MFYLCKLVKVDNFFFSMANWEKKLVVGLIIAIYPDGVRFLGLYDPSSPIPCWNANISSFLHILMAFALTYLHDDGTTPFVLS